MTRMSGIRLDVPLYIAAMLKSVFAITRVTGTLLLRNNSVPQEQRGAANGIATTAMSLSKAFTPAGAGILFSWAQKCPHAAIFPGPDGVSSPESDRGHRACAYLQAFPCGSPTMLAYAQTSLPHAQPPPSTPMTLHPAPPPQSQPCHEPTPPDLTRHLCPSLPLPLISTGWGPWSRW